MKLPADQYYLYTFVCLKSQRCSSHSDIRSLESDSESEMVAVPLQEVIFYSILLELNNKEQMKLSPGKNIFF